MNRPALLAFAASALLGVAALAPSASAAMPAAPVSVTERADLVEVRHGRPHGHRHRYRGCRHPIFETVRYWVPGHGWQRDRVVVGCARRGHWR